MKTTKQIRAYVLQCGHKRTNAEMAERLGVPRASFASVIGAMKRSGLIKNNFLKTDVDRLEKSKAASKMRKKTKTSNRRG